MFCSPKASSPSTNPQNRHLTPEHSSGVSTPHQSACCCHPRQKHLSRHNGSTRPAPTTTAPNTARGFPVTAARLRVTALPQRGVHHCISHAAQPGMEIGHGGGSPPYPSQISASSNRNPGSHSPPSSASAASIRSITTGAAGSAPGCQISTARCCGNSSQPSRAPLAR
jgi:hypothetical protein